MIKELLLITNLVTPVQSSEHVQTVRQTGPVCFLTEELERALEKKYGENKSIVMYEQTHRGPIKLVIYTNALKETGTAVFETPDKKSCVWMTTRKLETYSR